MLYTEKEIILIADALSYLEQIYNIPNYKRDEFVNYVYKDLSYYMQKYANSRSALKYFLDNVNDIRFKKDKSLLPISDILKNIEHMNKLASKINFDKYSVL